ncbi:MAG: hypothetical protein KKH29_05620 [Candidatus Omnitrophica bacterium]|nr:hypothetical protein [Candidatus Omnitrophota bacterium]MBU4472864.1 hypothetical protein [Candidatus Omnitrophota bacterium]MCG2706098.1 hypothetical protein [Candidatus Omnitrophota bacterium]
MQEKDQHGPERRKYIRLDSVFPVSFRLVSLDGKQIVSDYLQGFSNNIGKGGICLNINNLNPDLAKLIKTQQVKLSLGIEIPLAKNAVSALAKVGWVQDIIGEPNRYLIGLSYDNIDPRGNNTIMRYAWTKKLFVPSVVVIILILGLFFAINTYLNIKLIKGNKALVTQLINILQESSIAKQKIKATSKAKEDLQIKIQGLQFQIQNVNGEKADLGNISKLEEIKAAKKIEELNVFIEKLTQEKTFLQEQLIAVQGKEASVAEELLRLDKRKVHLEKANLDKMYQWLKVQQSPRTGLVISFEGDSDIAEWALIYDQALVACAFTNFGDFQRARKIMDFFDKKAKRIDKLFLNAYSANDGSPAEYAIHSGPNIWLGIAILQYTEITQDHSYLRLAQEIAGGIISLQDQDKDGGICGGPDLSWYSTEHNLDAYAFFNMLYKITGQLVYQQASDKVLTWLVQHTYDSLDIPVKRGRGDSTIATDTYAYSIIAIGPDKLEDLGMNPDRIIEFAEQNCAVEVLYTRPEGQTIKIKGFDFASQRHSPRGGVVSSEWTAQMVIAFKIVADFYHEKGMLAKARSYENKADEYLAELSNMIISSSSPSGQGESCLPYATQDAVDTGHGWMTPKGKFTGSVSGTTYTLFAYYDYNPLELQE